MKTKNGWLIAYIDVTAYLAILALVVVLVSAEGGPSSSASFNQSFNSLRLDVATNNEKYLVGELVNLKFKIVNQSPGQISLYPGSTVWDGYIDVFVAFQGEDFKRYRGPRWGLRDVFYEKEVTLKPGEAFDSDATMLCNPLLNTSHLNDAAAKRAQLRENLVQGNYVLSRPGFYFVKAFLRDPKSHDIIESTWVRIVAETPQGTDLEVWNKIKDSRDYAHFIQTGSLPNPMDQRTAQVVEELEEIVTLYPSSQYAQQIRRSLIEHRTTQKMMNDFPGWK